MNAPATMQMLPAGYDRQKYLGGSDVAAIFGVSPWRTPYDLWVDKIRRELREAEQAKKATEEAAAAEQERKVRRIAK